MSKFDFNFYNSHGPWWKWENKQMVFECECGDPIPCDQMKVAHSWQQHIQMIAEFMSSGNYYNLVGRETEEIVDTLWHLVEAELEKQ